jgi:DNA helicase IV
VLALPKPEKLVSRLLTSPAALAGAADGILDADERKLLLRDRPKRVSDLLWSVHDLPLLDTARTLVEGPPRAFGHVIVDEAQDLSPMQLLAISRRAVDGSLTILGDVAQATGPVVYRGWEELEPFLPDETEVTIEELRHAYRVPGEIMELALPLLDLIAPEMDRPISYRKGGEPPMLVSVPEDELLESALRRAAELDGLLAVIAPPSLAAAPPHGDTFDETSVPVLTPREAKGLEFDHVVVVEPARIAEEGGASGLRELYVALTRPTQTLTVVHARPLPAELLVAA